MKKHGFTLIELIVVITILAILGTIAFISFKGFSGDTRNAKVTTDLNVLHKGLSLYKIDKGSLPMPDSSVEVLAGTGNVITYEGQVGDVVRGQVNADKNMKNPKGNNYKYATNGTRKWFTLVGEYEQVSAYNTVANAESETKIFKGDEVLTLFNSDGDFIPGDVNASSISNLDKAYLGEKEMTIASNQVENVPTPILTNLSKFLSCQEYKNYGHSTKNGKYTIHLNGTPHGVYCDMTTDGGGWTLVMRGKSGDLRGNSDLLFWSTVNSVNKEGLDSVGETAKFSDNEINSIRGTKGAYMIKLDGLYDIKRYFKPYTYNHMKATSPGEVPGYSDAAMTLDERLPQNASNWMGIHDDINHTLFIMTHHQNKGWLVGDGVNHNYPISSGHPTTYPNANFSMWVR